MTSDHVIIEAALNGTTKKSRNPHVPVTPGEISQDALRCIGAGAAVIHNHIEDIWLTGGAAGERYGEAWSDILASDPSAILCPTGTLASDPVERQSHLATCAHNGARLGALDPGSINLADSASDGTPGDVRFTYINSYDDIEVAIGALRDAGLAASVGIYEPTFLRTTLAYHRAGQLLPGTMLKFYFAGRRDFLSGARPAAAPALGFGLPPTRIALAAYLEMMEGCALPWSVAVLGGDVINSGLARIALEQGGHLRVGLEDYAGEAPLRNVELVERAVALCKEVGRPVATCAEAAMILGFTRSSHGVDGVSMATAPQKMDVNI